LSGGQQQRVALARALAPRPRAVLLDEPFNTLDASLRAQVRSDLLGILRVEGVAVLLVTHDQDEALTCADRVAVMRAGRLEQVDAPTALYNRPATRFVAGFVGEGTLLPAQVAGGVVATPFGAVAAADPAIWLLSGPAELLVRPEDVALEPDPQGSAAVVSRYARGPEVEYEISLRPEARRADRADRAEHQARSAAGGPLPTLHVHAPLWLPTGAYVRATLRLRHLVLFPAGRDGRAAVSRCLIANCTCPVPETGWAPPQRPEASGKRQGDLTHRTGHGPVASR
jgi:ABC-type Fe3+/spermidine/putrescine transport system ATPase subunit